MKPRASLIREITADLLVLVGVPVAFRTLVRTDSVVVVLACMGFLTLLSVQACLLFHDTLHGATFRRDVWNRWLGRLIGAFYFWPFSFLRGQHLAHHVHAGLLDGDTELVHPPESVSAARRGGRFLARLARTPLAPLLYAPVMQSFNLLDWLSAPTRHVRETRFRGLVVDGTVMAILWIGLDLWLMAQGRLLRGFFLGLLLPAFGALVVIYLASKPLHTNMTAYPLRGHGPTARVLLTSRTFETTWLARHLIANLNYHVEHHLFPRASRWELPELARQLRPELEVRARQLGFPLQRHPGYLRWYEEHREVARTYNPNASLRDFVAHNEHFTLVSSRFTT